MLTHCAQVDGKVAGGTEGIRMGLTEYAPTFGECVFVEVAGLPMPTQRAKVIG